MKEIEKKDISVYIHIPFSIKIRRGDNTLLVDSTRETRNMYLDALEREMLSAEDVLEGRRIVSIFMGGGIATSVSPDKLARIMVKFKKMYNIAPRAEISITAAPQTLVTPCLSSLNMFNINRISLIAFSPVDSLLNAIDAPHRLVDIENGSAMLVKFGYRDIDANLMYGIPGQTLTTIRNTVKAFTSVKGFQHITLKSYELSDQCGVTIKEREDQYRHAVEILAERNLEQYTSDSFAFTGKQSLFTLNELMGVERIGFGLGAKSYIDDYCYQNTTDFNRYLQYSEDFSRLITGVTQLKALDQKKRYIALRLQLVQGFREAEYKEKFGSLSDNSISVVLGKLSDEGLIESVDGSIRPTEKGLMRSTELVSTVIG